MAKIIWAETALEELNAICEFIQIVNEEAAKKLFRNVFETVGNLELHPEIGAFPQEISHKRYRYLLCQPCKIFYRYENGTAFIVHVFRTEMDVTDEILQK